MRSFINNEYPEMQGYGESSKISFDFSNADYEYIDLNSIMHSFVLDNGHVGIDSLKVAYVHENSIIESINIKTKTGNTIINYNEYFLMFSFVSKMLNKVDSMQHLKDKRLLVKTNNAEQLINMPYYEKLKFSVDEHFYIQKDFKLEIALNKKEYISICKEEDLKRYTYKDPKLYYKGTNTQPDTATKHKLFELKFILLNNSKNKHTLKFNNYQNTIHNFFFIVNNDSLNNTLFELNKISTLRQYTDEETKDLVYNIENFSYVGLHKAFSGDDGQTANKLTRTLKYILPEYLKIENAQEKFKLDYGYMYYNGKTRNHFIHQLELIENINSAFNVDLVKNIEIVNNHIISGYGFAMLMGHHFFTYVPGHHNSLAITVSRPLSTGIDNSSTDRLYNLTIYEKKI